jgi:hypothetical protein
MRILPKIKIRKMEKYIICKKEILYSNKIIFKIGEKYEIKYTDIDLSPSGLNYFIYNKENIKLYFSSIKDSGIYVYDYFYTEKELRNLKIKKLNEKMPDL